MCAKVKSTELVCARVKSTELVCAIVKSTELICARVKSTELFCARVKSTELLCARVKSTELLCAGVKSTELVCARIYIDMYIMGMAYWCGLFCCSVSDFMLIRLIKLNCIRMNLALFILLVLLKNYTYWSEGHCSMIPHNPVHLRGIYSGLFQFEKQDANICAILPVGMPFP